MKPAGRERDIEIAELRDYKIGSTSQGSVITSKGIISKTGEAIWGRKNGWPITCKHWSTNRDHAWELWDDMTKDGSYLKYEQENDDLHYVSFKGGNKISGKDFADCVSQAWLIWKNKKGEKE